MSTRNLPIALPFVLSMLALAPQASAQESAGALVGLPSIAEPDGVKSLLHNPGGLATLQAWEIRIFNTQLEGAGEGTAVLYGMPVVGPVSLGTAIEWLRPPLADSRVRFSLGAGVKLHEALRLGLVWRHVFADLEAADGLDALDVGLLVRLASWISIGATVSDLNTPVVANRVLPRVYGLGLAFRPGTDRVGIEVGASIREDDGQVDAIGRLRFEPIPGLEVLGRVVVRPRDAGVGLEIGTGLAFHFGPAGVEAQSYVAQPAGGGFAFDGFSIGVRLSGASYGPLVRRTDKTVILELGSAPEVPKPGLLGGGFTFTHLVHYLDRLRTDDTVSGVLLRDRRTGFGWAQAEEVRDAIDELKKAGKRITVYLDQGELRHLYMYAGADRIVLNPAGGLMITGLRSTLTFYREALDKLHIRTQWAKYGKYKTYPEAFDRTEPTQWSLEVRNSMLDTILNTVVKGVASGRKLTEARVRALIDEGPFVADEAKEAGLVDHLAFYDEVAEWMKKDQGKPVRLVAASAGPRRGRERWVLPDAVAIIPIEGSIVEGKSGSVPFIGSAQAGSDTVIAAVEAAAANPRVKGIVLRVNSPGGSSVASDHMHRAIFKAAKGKPIVASFGNVSASGGYYLAMGAREVLASDLTVTGSIGIFTGKPAFGDLLRLLGIGRQSVARGKNADLFSTDEPWTDDQLKLVMQKLKVFYDLFLKRVADNRKMTVEEVHELAQGRVWLGSQARNRKLVDHRGGVIEAIRRIKSLSGLEADEPVDLVFLPKANLLQRVRNTLGIEIQVLLERLGNLKEALAVAYPFLNGFQPGEPLALMPVVLTFE